MVALTNKQDTIPFLARLIVTRFDLLLTFLIDASLCSARLHRKERLSSAGCSIWVSSFPERGKGATGKKRPLPDSIGIEVNALPLGSSIGDSPRYFALLIPDRDVRSFPDVNGTDQLFPSSGLHPVA